LTNDGPAIVQALPATLFTWGMTALGAPAGFALIMAIDVARG
jgi:hypothetical protein